MRTALLVSCNVWWDHIGERLTGDAATEDTDTDFCLPINATEAETASNCNCFTSVDLSDSGGMNYDRLAPNRANTNVFG